MDNIFDAVNMTGIRADALSGVMFVLVLMAIAFVSRLIIGLIFPQSGLGGATDDN